MEGHSTEFVAGLLAAASVFGGLAAKAGDWLIERIKKARSEPSTVSEKLEREGVKSAMEFLEDQLNSANRSHKREVKELVDKLEASMEAHHDCEVKHERMEAAQKYMQLEIDRQKVEINDLRDKLQRSKQARPNMPDFSAMRRDRESREHGAKPDDSQS